MKSRIISLIILAVAVIGLTAAGIGLYLKNAPSPSRTAPETAGPSTQPQPETASQGCPIIIDGKIYDVAALRSPHPGGDIFKCGTDMSSVYHGKHGESIKRIEKYLVK